MHGGQKMKLRDEKLSQGDADSSGWTCDIETGQVDVSTDDEILEIDEVSTMATEIQEIDPQDKSIRMKIRKVVSKNPAASATNLTGVKKDKKFKRKGRKKVSFASGVEEGEVNECKKIQKKAALPFLQFMATNMETKSSLEDNEISTLNKEVSQAFLEPKGEPEKEKQEAEEPLLITIKEEDFSDHSTEDMDTSLTDCQKEKENEKEKDQKGLTTDKQNDDITDDSMVTVDTFAGAIDLSNKKDRSNVLTPTEAGPPSYASVVKTKVSIIQFHLF